MANPTVCLIDALELLAPYDYEHAALAQHGIDLTLRLCESTDEVIAQARGAQVLWTLALPVTREALAALPDCRMVMRWGVGYDVIDVQAATDFGVAVTNCPAYCTDDVADHAAALVLAAVRKVAKADREIRQGIWSSTSYRPITRLRGQTLGFIGFGRIARATSARLVGFGFRHLAYDPYLDPAAIRGAGAEPVDLDTLLAQADIISVHVPLGPTTRGLIGAAQLARMKPTAYLVNTSRGPIIDEAALAQALQAGQLYGAALDVFEQEPLPLDSPLRQFANVTLTPHMGAHSVEATADLRREACDTSVEWFATGWAKTVVNPQVRETLRG